VSQTGDRKPALTATGQRAVEQHQRRLAAALRENLKKRKVQERARAGVPSAPMAASDDPADGGGAE
jgi:hypothetical protein